MTVTKLPILLVAMATLFLVSLAYGTPEKTVYSFGSPGSGDGMYPYSKLVVDANGNLYGTTSQGGTYNAGIVFELSSGSDGQWVETVIHEFTGQADGASPFAGIVFDRAGNLYGTAGYGGANGTGVVFVLSPEAGAWTYKVLYNFGAYPQSGDGLSPNPFLSLTSWGICMAPLTRAEKRDVFRVVELSSRCLQLAMVVGRNG